MDRIERLAALAMAAVVIAGCGGNTPTPAGTTGGELKGKFGVFYVVNVSRPVGGTIRSTDGLIDCGPVTGTKNLCGPVSYDWDHPIALSATADVGQYFQTWAADCSGAVAVDGCVLDTATGGADKWVAAVFNPPGQLGHAKIPAANQHGPLYFKFVQNVGVNPQCNVCHGRDYNGVANAPSCNACHTSAGHPDWQNDCTFCHGAPPATHAVTSTNCNQCHPDTVLPGGAINTVTGKHMNGSVEASGGGHAPGFSNPAAHGPQYLSFVGGVAGATDCTTCHTAALTSCNNCHSGTGAGQGGGWVSWKSNCTFCHGTATKTYTAGDLANAAPPVAVIPWLTTVPESLRIGKHAAHATSTCGTCHVVPTDLSHIGSTGRATVTLAGYNPVTSTCTVSCHGGATQNWDTAAPSLSCTSCHDTPPQTGASSGPWVNSADNMHDGHVWDAPEWGAYKGNVEGLWDAGYEAVQVCVDCHATSVNPNGTIRAFGTHTNGVQGDVAFGAGLGGSATVTPSQVTCATACHGAENWH